MKRLAKEELSRLTRRRKKSRGVKNGSSPKDPHDEKNILLEIRAGRRRRSRLFAGSLQMYSKFAEKKVGARDTEPSLCGSRRFKEIIAQIEGKRVYSQLKFESGVHRVQRVPVTEAQGRIHTSTVTVASFRRQKRSMFRLIPMICESISSDRRAVARV